MASKRVCGKKRRPPAWLLLLLIACSGACTRRHRAYGPAANDRLTCETIRRVPDDYAHYYSRRGTTLIAAGLGAAAIMANTDFDGEVQSWYQEDVRTGDGDDFSQAIKFLGEGQYVFPVLGASLLLGDVLEESFECESTLGRWSGRSLRAAAVGTPPMLLMQLATGASRPGESSAGSDWKPFDDNNGVSGHAFVGAIPLITAAQMTDRPWQKAGLYFASTLPAWSRVNDDAHYVSQSIAGWWMAYLACSAVSQTDCEYRRLQLAPIPLPGGAGIGVMFEH